MLRLDVALQNQVIRFLISWAADVKTLARQLVPVKTGYLQSKIYATVKDWTVNVGAEAAYAYLLKLARSTWRLGRIFTQQFRRTCRN